MGADLYINSIFKPQQEKYEKKFDEWVKIRNGAKLQSNKDKAQEKVSYYYNKMYEIGYFRDSYNGSNLLWKYGLDYWGWFGKLLDKKGMLSPKNAKKILNELTEREDIFGESLYEADKDEKHYFIKKDKEFRDFLEMAIKLGEPVVCSI